MRNALKWCGSLRALVIIMIAAPILPTIGLGPLMLMRLGRHWHEFEPVAAIGLTGVSLRILGGLVALAAAGRLIVAMRTLSRAANALADGAPPPREPSGIADIDNVIGAMSGAAASLHRRSLEYERAEAARRASEARLRDFAETGSDWYWETDREHRFTHLSERIRFFGQDPKSRLGRARWELRSDPSSEPEKWRDHKAALEPHEPFRDFCYARKVGDQPEQTVAVSGKPIFDEAGQFCGYRGTARDISERMRAERSLREAKAEAEAASLAKSRFLANMSHELRTPLNAILGFAEVIEQGTAGPLRPRQQEYVGYIRESGAHLLEIINEILDLAKIDAGRLDLDEDSGIEIRPLALTCIGFVKDRAVAEGLTLALEIDETMPPLRADQTRLKQILLNLLGNAVKFTDRGGAVVLAVRRTAEGAIEFEVRDTGIGMTAAEVAIASEPFGQVDTGLTRRHEGTGLGLPLARRLTELHGGTFSIDSEKGRGTRVVVALPAARLQQRRSTTVETGESAAAISEPALAG